MSKNFDTKTDIEKPPALAESAAGRVRQKSQHRDYSCFFKYHDKLTAITAQVLEEFGYGNSKPLSNNTVKTKARRFTKKSSLKS